MRIDLTLSEMSDLKVLASLAPSADARLAGLAVESKNGETRWTVTDNRKLLTLRRGTASRDGRGAVPARELVIACEIAENRGLSALIVFDDTDGDSGAIFLNGLAVEFSMQVTPFVDVARSAESQPRGDCEVVVDAARLVEGIDAVIATTTTVKDLRRKNFVVYTDGENDALLIRASWVGRSDTSTQIVARCQKDGFASVDPLELRTVVSLAGDTNVTLIIGQTPSVPLRARMTNGIELIVMPAAYGIERERGAFEAILKEVRDSAPGALERDEDGDYLLPLRNGEMAWICLRAGNAQRKFPDHIELFTTIVRDVEVTAEALREINAQNARFPFARLWAGDRFVNLATHVTLENLTPSLLRSGIEILADVADFIQPLLASYFDKLPDANDSPPAAPEP